MSKTWGNIGAWAAETERAEAEEREQAAAAAAAAGGGDSQSFPTLREAAATKQKKKKMSLQEFTMQTSSAVTGGRGLTPDDMLRLPTGPKERSAEEMQYGGGRLGGGFPNYGRSGGFPSGRPMRAGDGDGDTSWGGGGRRSYGGGFEHDDRRASGPSRFSDFDQPSRADETDNWATGKKTLPSLDSVRPNRYSSLGGGVGGVPGASRADEVDSWGAGKKPISPRSSPFGSNFRDLGPESDRWTRGRFNDGGGDERQRPRLVLDPPRKDGAAVVEPVKTNKPNPFGAARPREEVLAEKGLDWKKLDLEIEAKKSSRPTSSQSSRPTSSQSNRSDGGALQQGIEGAVRAKPKVNPFGDAKPREVLLQERGLDWRKIDLELEHRSVDRPETEVEKDLKEEIDHLKEERAKESASNATADLHDIILGKERDLDLLSRELDDRVRFGQRVSERPGSGAGRPGSRSGSFDGSRSMELMDRPRSRGTGDRWARPSDDRRAFQGGMEFERGFMGNRGMDRPRSRERW